MTKKILDAKRILLYGTGETGKLFMNICEKNNKKYETYDDILASKTLGSLQEVREYDPDFIIICSQTQMHTDSIKLKIESLGLTSDLYVPSHELVDYIRMMMDVADKIDYEIFEENDFLVALKNGYLNFGCEYCDSGAFDSWYSYNEIKVDQNDIVIDCGASCAEIHDSTPAYFVRATTNTIYAFEPEPTAYSFLKKEMKDHTNVKVLNYAVGECNGKMYFHVGSCSDSHITDNQNENSIEVDVVKIDDIVNDGRVDFIKMDIEGGELAALNGAKETIKKYKPKLAICVYHKPDDPITIPKLIKEFDPNYKIWIVNNEGHFWMGTKIFACVD